MSQMKRAATLLEELEAAEEELEEIFRNDPDQDSAEAAKLLFLRHVVTTQLRKMGFNSEGEYIDV